MSVSSTNLFRKAMNLEISPEFQQYTGVRIYTGIQNENNEEIVYEAGDMTSGRVLEIENEWGTQAQANNILAQIQGWSYKPYTADGAILDPAAELNDGVTLNGVYSGICSKAIRFGTLMDTDIAAPKDEEVDYEYTYKTSTERAIARQTKEFRSELKIQASQIAARVSSSGGNASSFGWVLTDHDHSWYSGDSQVMVVNASGLRVNGLIEAVEFRTSAGQKLATSAELESLRTASYAGMTGGNGFLGAIQSAFRVGNNTQNGRSATQLEYIYVKSGFLNKLSLLTGSDNIDDASVTGMCAAFIYLYVNGNKASWQSDSVVTSVSGWAGADSWAWVEDYYGNLQYVVTGVDGGASGSTTTLNYLGR